MKLGAYQTTFENWCTKYKIELLSFPQLLYDSLMVSIEFIEIEVT